MKKTELFEDCTVTVEADDFRFERGGPGDERPTIPAPPAARRGATRRYRAPQLNASEGELAERLHTLDILLADVADQLIADEDKGAMQPSVVRLLQEELDRLSTEYGELEERFVKVCGGQAEARFRLADTRH